MVEVSANMWSMRHTVHPAAQRHPAHSHACSSCALLLATPTLNARVWQGRDLQESQPCLEYGMAVLIDVQMSVCGGAGQPGTQMNDWRGGCIACMQPNERG